MVIPVCCQEEGSRKVIAAAVARLLGTNQIDPHAASLSGQRQLAAWMPFPSVWTTRWMPSVS